MPRRLIMSLLVAIAACTLAVDGRAVEPTPIESAAGEIEALRQEVAAASLLKDELERLRTQVEALEQV